MSRSYPAAAMAFALVVALVPAAIGGAAAAEQVTLTLSVENDAGEPVGGADLAVDWGNGSETVTTRANGQALVDVPSGTDPTVTVSHPTYMRNHPFEIQDASTRGETIPVSRSGQVSVTVLGSTGQIGDASVRLYRSGRWAANERTDGDGLATTDPLERGSYGLVVSKPGYVTNETRIDVTGDVERTVRITPGAVEVRFNVTDDHFSPPRPVENASVAIQETGTTLTTLGNGQQSTNVPVNRKYTIEVSKPGYETRTTQLDVGESGTVVDIDVRRTPAIDVETANRQVVVGETTRVTVTNEYGEPVEGATLTVDDGEAGTTDADGVADVTIDAAGEVTVRATSGDLSAETTVEGVGTGGDSTDDPAAGTTSAGGPGFTPLVALVALLAVAFVASRGRR